MLEEEMTLKLMILCVCEISRSPTFFFCVFDGGFGSLAF